jgi:hypothetical protein
MFGDKKNIWCQVATKEVVVLDYNGKILNNPFTAGEFGITTDRKYIYNHKLISTDDVYYYFNDYDPELAFDWTNPDLVVDEEADMWTPTTFGYAAIVGFNDYMAISNTCDGTDLGTITNVYINAYGKKTAIKGDPGVLTFTPMYGGTDPGTNMVFTLSTTPGWCGYTEITGDLASWNWSDIQHMYMNINVTGTCTTKQCAEVVIKVTYES